MSFTDDEMASCLKVLQCIADDPSLADHEDRFRSLIVKVRSRGRRHRKHLLQSDPGAETGDGLTLQNVSADSGRLLQIKPGMRSIERDRALQAETGIVAGILRPHQLPTGDRESDPSSRLIRPQKCYVCKVPFVELHFHYYRLCPNCAALNWEKRRQTVDLTGRFAIVTGGRIKIGYLTALRMLRDGARVLVTTRFPVDAATRFQAEADFTHWQDRLRIVPLDLRNLSSVESFAGELLQTEVSLEILVHNAAQTIKRPLAFYRHLLDQPAQDLVQSSLISPGRTPSALLECHPQYQGHLPGTEQYFPAALRDEYGQQKDLRPDNSWKLKLGAIGTVELLEVLLVNTASPFVLTSGLLPLMQRSRFERRFIVNVSAMEGQFIAFQRRPIILIQIWRKPH